MRASVVSKALIILAIIVIGILFAIDITSEQAPSHSPSTIPLASVEVRSYQGENLSSVNDFRENSIKGPQYVNESTYRLTITGLTNKTIIYRYEDVINTYQSYSKVVTLDCVEGWDVTILWEGVLVQDILNTSGVDPQANTVIFHAIDGYTTSFPIEYLQKNDILMAYRMNNVTIPAERGFPFMLVAEDKWGYKWIKWIDRIELSNDTSYRGYWEQRGYSNSGDLNKSFFSF
jgi:DMSO/TMAO reductase YedYZ molybdopterin-dependent catalytic subunit